MAYCFGRVTMNASIDACGEQRMHLSLDNGVFRNSTENGHLKDFLAFRSRLRWYFLFSIWLYIGKCYGNLETMCAAIALCTMCGMYSVR